MNKQVRAIYTFLFCVVLLCSMACFGMAADGDFNLPDMIKATNSGDSVCVSWDYKDICDGFRVYRSEEGAPAVLVGEASVDEREFVDGNVTSGNVYDYYISAIFDETEIQAEDSCTIMYLKAPEITFQYNNTQGIVLGWSAVEGAEGYLVYKDNDETPVTSVDADVLSYTDCDVTHGKGHTYSIVAYCGMSESDAVPVNSKIFVEAPTVVSVSAGEGFVRFRWQGVQDADNYYVYKKNSNGGWQFFTKTSGKAIYIVDRNVKSGEKCTYTIQAVKNGAISGYDSAGASGIYVDKPATTKVINAKNGLFVSWSKVQGAASYNLYRRDTVNTSWKLVYTGSATYFQDNRVANGVYFAYTVRAISSMGNYSVCDSRGTSIIALKMPSVKLGCSPYGVVVSWTKFNSADEYRVYRKATDETSWKCVGVVGKNRNTYITDTKVTQGKSYYYTVKQFRNGVPGSYIIGGVKATFYKAPVLSVGYGSGGVTLSWSKSAVGMGYAIDRRVAGGAWKQIAALNGLNTLKLVDKGFAKGQENFYRIRVTSTNLVSNTASLKGIDTSRPMVALTYDDGPYSPVTGRILNTLEQYDAKATFFVVGNRVNSYKSCVTRAYNMGCEIANHTYSHTILTSAGDSTVISEINKTNNVVKNVTGKAPVIVRAPGGSVNSRVLRLVDYPFVGWDVDTLDWQSRNSASVVAKIKNNVRNGSIVLMHDLYASTASATETIVPWLVNRGYQLVTVSELMDYKNINFHGGKVYHCAY